MKNSLIIIGFFIFGIVTGLYSFAPEFLINTDFTTYALCILMFFVGVSVGLDENAWKILKNAKLKIILVPLSVIIGTLLGAGLFSLLISDISLRESLAVGAGFRGSLYSDFDFIVFTTDDFNPPLWLNREPDGKPFSQDEWNLAYRQKDFILDKFDAEIFFIHSNNLTNPDFIEQAEKAGIPLSESSSHQFITVYQNDFN